MKWLIEPIQAKLAAMGKHTYTYVCFPAYSFLVLPFRTLLVDENLVFQPTDLVQICEMPETSKASSESWRSWLKANKSSEPVHKKKEQSSIAGEYPGPC
jgi:hypothetical protein